MSQEAVERVLGRLLTDDEFRTRAACALAEACREEGYRLTREELGAIRQQDLEALAVLARDFDSSIKRFCHRPAAPGAEGNQEGKLHTGEITSWRVSACIALIMAPISLAALEVFRLA